jgi:pyruvate formate lyase activating enzyme
VTEEGVIFDIQRFSIHDGPGIRSLVFLKGCPLRCPWCSNPESQRFEIDLLFQPEKCIGCKRCMEMCPHGAILANDGELSFDRDLCQNCGRCAESCYAEARVMSGRRVTADWVLQEVLKDEAFFSKSGGGVTLGGGEPLAQANFAAAILKKCKEKGIHTAIETAGCVPWSQVERVIPFVDLFHYDVKHMDSAIHERNVGMGNELILANLRRLVEVGKKVVVCTPLIPEFNATMEAIGAIARHVYQLGIREMHLLPYHNFGKSKYRLLGRPYSFGHDQKLKDEEIDRLRETAAERRLQVKVGG